MKVCGFILAGSLLVTAGSAMANTAAPSQMYNCPNGLTITAQAPLGSSGYGPNKSFGGNEADFSYEITGVSDGSDLPKPLFERVPSSTGSILYHAEDMFDIGRDLKSGESIQLKFGGAVTRSGPGGSFCYYRVTAENGTPTHSTNGSFLLYLQTSPHVNYQGYGKNWYSKWGALNCDNSSPMACPMVNAALNS